MKSALLITFALSGLLAFGQDNSRKIKEIKTVDEANSFIKANPKLNGTLFEINSGTDSSATSKKILADNSGNPFQVEGYTYKVVETKKSFLINVFYIYLDGSKLSMKQIDSVRQIIVSKYNSGAPFTALAKEYNMDGSPSTDLRSIPEGMLLPDFTAAVKEHKQGEVFTINLPEKKWYYVTQKTFNEQEVKIYSILKVKNNN